MVDNVQPPNELVFRISVRLVVALNDKLGILIHDDPQNIDIKPNSFTHNVAMEKYYHGDSRVLNVCTSKDGEKARLFIGWIDGKKLFEGFFRDLAHFETWLPFIMGVFVTNGFPIGNKTTVVQ